MADDVSKKINLQPIANNHGLKPKEKKSIVKKVVLSSVLVILVSIIGSIVGAYIWYNGQLAPFDVKSNELRKVTIPSGSTLDQIGKILQKESIIKSSFAFNIYLRVSGVSNKLQAGVYRLSSSESTPQIVKHLITGSVDTFEIMFYPGATLVDNTNKAEDKKQDVTSVLERAGYSSEEIKTALAKTYISPLFVGKPSGADLEGYIFGDTYKFGVGATVEEILNHVFEVYYSEIQKYDLESKFAKHNLTLYQGITLASIIQREANSVNDQKQVAQVFYSRLDIGMELGSDVTYQYIADKTGVARDPNLDSPYNTRRYAGLPPGPIAVPGLTALQAVAGPASGDYLYFLSGDDDVTYFAKTYAEHEANIVDHCKMKCSTP